MKLKVCGITCIHQLHQLEELEVRYAGFIFHNQSPRNVVKSGLQGAAVKKSKVKVYKVGVFVNSTFDEVTARVDEYGLDMVQLHGNETPYQCEKILSHIDVIKAFRFAENDHVKWTIQDYYKCSDMFLMDTGIPAPVGERDNKLLHGGTGRKFSWKRLRGLSIDKPFLLSGGIEPTGAGSVKEFIKDHAAKDLVAVDINSRFETKPGIKDMSKVKSFIEELRS